MTPVCLWRVLVVKVTLFCVMATQAGQVLGQSLDVPVTDDDATKPASTVAPVLMALQESLSTAIERAERSVVAIARARQNEAPNLLKPDYVPAEFATGVVVDAEGLILTTAHVLGRPAESDYAVWVAGRPFPATIKAIDPWIDLAVLSIDAKDLVPIEMGDADRVKKGHFVICLGNPYAIARDGHVSATWGIVANLGRKAQTRPIADRVNGEAQTVHQYGTLIQTDARLYQGTSGGAMVDLEGKMIGLTTSLAALEGYDRAAGYAIPMNKAIVRVLEQLKAGKQPEYGFLGVAPEHLTLEERQREAIGARLTQVEPGTPAARYGLREDDVVTHVDNLPVYSPTDLIRLVSLSPVGEPVQLQIRRQNSLLRREDSLTKPIVLTKRYVTAHEQGTWTVAPQKWRGMTVDYATAIPAYYQHSTEIDPEGCVVVSQVDQDSPAWRAGLRKGAFVSHVGETRVQTPAEFFAAIPAESEDADLRTTTAVNGKGIVTVESP